jgi:hypothetical protein
MGMALSKYGKTNDLQKWARIHRIWMRQNAKLTGRHAPWSLSLSRSPKTPNEYFFSQMFEMCKISIFMIYGQLLCTHSLYTHFPVFNIHIQCTQCSHKK